jgi:putative lipoic acid-binding regulatory protein
MRATQGVEDKHEARREIKVSTSGEYKGVNASANTIHINRAQIQYTSLLVSRYQCGSSGMEH